MARRAFTTSERRARLARRHRLTPSTKRGDPAAIADSVVALHSSDPVSVYLSAAARMPEPALAPLDRALYDDRSVVRHHAMRRTLWVMTPEVLVLAHASSTRKLAAAERKRTLKMLADNEVAGDVDAWLDNAQAQVLAELRSRGEATTRELGDAIPSLRAPLVLAPGKSYGTTVAAHTRVLLLLGFDGAIVRGRPTGTWINGQYRWADMATWTPGGVGELTERAAMAGLTARWLRAFGPATAEDLRWWTGWTKTATRRALDDVGATEVDLESGATGWSTPDDLEPEEEAGPWVALLPGLDPTTMGWKERDWYLAPDRAAALFDANGNGGPTAWVDGRVVGGWAQRRDGEIVVRLVEDVGRDAERALDAAAHELTTLLGDVRFSVRFPSPQHEELVAG